MTYSIDFMDLLANRSNELPGEIILVHHSLLQPALELPDVKKFDKLDKDAVGQHKQGNKSKVRSRQVGHSFCFSNGCPGDCNPNANNDCGEDQHR